MRSKVSVFLTNKVKLRDMAIVKVKQLASGRVGHVHDLVLLYPERFLTWILIIYLKRKNIVKKYISMFRISLGSVLLFLSVLCLRFEALYLSPLPKPTAHLPGWVEVGVRFLVAVFQASSEGKLAFVSVTSGMTETGSVHRCTVWRVGHGAWSLVRRVLMARGGTDK